MVEHFHGKEEVASSILAVGTKKKYNKGNEYIFEKNIPTN